MMNNRRTIQLIVLGCGLLMGMVARAQQQSDIERRLGDFDAYMQKVLKDFNTPGICVGIVVTNKLVFAKGYGYRDYDNKLPFTPRTLFPLGSNTKLFTAVAAGMLVEEGKLTWDKPIRQAVPTIQFYNDELNNNVTLRDMLSHRTGVTRHDMMWFKSPFTQKELFDRLKYLEPQEPLRQSFIYNNLMYIAVGHIIELKSGQPWEQFVRERIMVPLDMTGSVYTIADMLKQPEPVVRYREKRDTFELYKAPYYEDTEGVAPAGALISNVEEMSHWLIALMNEGKYNGKQVLPVGVLKATLEPAVALPDDGQALGYWEWLNPDYGMGRYTAAYRGHFITYHGGVMQGFVSQMSYLPKERIGVIVFVMCDPASVVNVVGFNVYERLLGLDQTPWSERMLERRLANKKAGSESRSKAGADRVPNTKPSHALVDYTAEYENPVYGIVKIGLKGGQLDFTFHKIQLPLNHFHYDRFDTPDDEQEGQFSVNFRTNPQGDINEAVISLDLAEAVFTRKTVPLGPKLLEKCAGAYLTPTKLKFEVTYNPGTGLAIVWPGSPPRHLIQIKNMQFRTPDFVDVVYEFLLEKEQVKGLKETKPSGQITYPRQ
jgi:CubicO group peptidase (beta-lactamase class C family)